MIISTKLTGPTRSKKRSHLSEKEVFAFLSVLEAIEDYRILAKDGLMSKVPIVELRCSHKDLLTFIDFVRNSPFFREPKAEKGVMQMNVELVIKNGLLMGLPFVMLKEIKHFVEKERDINPPSLSKNIFTLEQKGLVYKNSGQITRINDGTRRILQSLASATSAQGTQELANSSGLKYKSISKSVNDINKKIEDKFMVPRADFIIVPRRAGSGYQINKKKTTINIKHRV